MVGESGIPLIGRAISSTLPLANSTMDGTPCLHLSI